MTREAKFKTALRCRFSTIFEKIFMQFSIVLKCAQKRSKMISEDFRESIWARKKIKFFRDILHMPAKSMRISLRIFSFSRNLKNLNPSPDFKMSQIFEILSDFAHSEIWWSWKRKFSKDFEKSRFSTFWTPDLLQKPLSPSWFSAAFLRSGAYSTSKVPKIAFFSNRRKNHGFISIIL